MSLMGDDATISVQEVSSTGDLYNTGPTKRKWEEEDDEGESSGLGLEEQEPSPVRSNYEDFLAENDNFQDDPRITYLSDPIIMSSDMRYTEPISIIQTINYKLIRRLKLNRVYYLLPVQGAVLRWILKRYLPLDLGGRRDVCVSAPPGSGKTLTYVLIVLHVIIDVMSYYKQGEEKSYCLGWLAELCLQRPQLEQFLYMKISTGIQALIVVPTQELAIHVFQLFNEYAPASALQVGIAAGGNEISLEEERIRLFLYLGNDRYESKVDILIATPERLVAHLKHTRGFSLAYLRFLIVDGADIILKTMPYNWFEHITRNIKHRVQSKYRPPFNEIALKAHIWPQKLLFSETTDFDLENLGSLNLSKPKFIIAVEEDSLVGRKFILAQTVGEFYIVVEPHLKLLTIYDLIVEKKWIKNMIFTKSSEATYSLACLLRRFVPGIQVGELFIQQTPQERLEIIQKFVDDDNYILVTCDGVTREWDIPGIQNVISYDPTTVFKDYIYRASHTGRDGIIGHYVTILCNSEAAEYIDQLIELNRSTASEIKIDFREHAPIVMGLFKVASKYL